MATTTVSAWGKPGAWALEAEENDAAEELIQQQEKEKEKEKSKLFKFSHQQKEELQPLADFPSLSTAVATKTKKKKAVPISLSEFQSSSQPAKGLTTQEILKLPTGPRERTAEEIERDSGGRGFGFRSYNREERSDEPRSRGGFRDRENTRDSSGPSRADESDYWGSKKSTGGGPPERRERGSGGGFFGGGGADESENWGDAKRSSRPPSFERRERGAGGGFPDTGSRADESDSWVTNKSRVSTGSPPPRRFERERRDGFGFQKENSNGGGPDSDTWGKKREEVSSPTGMGNGARPKLVLKPRTLSPTNGEEQPGTGTVTKTKGSNPFGDARPREEILESKGQDWKKMDEQFDSIKIKENSSNGAGPTDGSSFGKKSFGNGNGSETERSWRKPGSRDVSPPQSAEVENEDGGVAAETETEIAS